MTKEIDRERKIIENFVNKSMGWGIKFTMESMKEFIEEMVDKRHKSRAYKLKIVKEYLLDEFVNTKDSVIWRDEEKCTINKVLAWIDREARIIKQKH